MDLRPYAANESKKGADRALTHTVSAMSEHLRRGSPNDERTLDVALALMAESTVRDGDR